MSLRAELLGTTDDGPQFAVLLPAGWESVDPSLDDVEGRARTAMQVLPAAARHATTRQLSAMLASARAEATKGKIIRLFSPLAAPDEVAPPVSLVASWLRVPAGGTTEQMVHDIVAAYGAAPFDPAGTILRWTLTSSKSVEGADIDTDGAGYLLRVPHHADRLLLFRSVILRGVGTDRIADDGVAAMTLACDAIVASVRWRRSV